VVIDHMGGFDVEAGVDEPGFRTLLGLLERGRVHVKLCAYRNMLGKAPLEAGLAFHRAMVEANAERLVWGSDWPHLRVVPAPDAAGLLSAFERWTADEAAVRRVLVDNPQQLYG
jgi:predicted TIM-barrel fold metal-dependent hydrolase